MKIKYPKQKIILSFALLLFIMLFIALDLECIYMHFFNFPCPGCGMTRAWLSVLRFDFLSAFKYHPMFWSVPIGYIYFMFDGKLINKGKADKIILYSIAAGFIIVWMIKIFSRLL